MYVLGVDFETTGLSAETDSIIEIGAVVWDTEHKKPLRMMSELIQVDKKLSPEIIEITGITDEDLAKQGSSLESGIQQLIELSKGCKYLVGHNGREFDKLFLDKALGQLGLELNTAWIDTLYDVPYKDSISSRKLTHLCADHGFLNPFSHRAVFDVLSMLSVMSLYSFDEIEKLFQSPSVKIVAKVSYDDREKAKKAGFRWDPANRYWFKKLKECQIQGTQFEFPTETMCL